MTHLQETQRKPASVCAAILAAVAAAYFLTGCGNIWTNQEAFVPEEKPMPVINGATLFPKIIPVGGKVKFSLNTLVYFAGVEDASGPYAIYIVAHGKPGFHETLTVREIKLHTSYGKTESVPYSMLGNPIQFRQTTDPSIAQTVFGCDLVWNPGKWQDVGPVDMEVEATVTAEGKSETLTFTCHLEPQIRKKRHFETLGGEFLRVIQRKRRLIKTE